MKFIIFFFTLYFNKNLTCYFMLNLWQQIIVDNRVNCREQLLESIIFS